MNQASIEVFKAGLQDQLIQPGDENYDDACKVYNAMIKRHPRLIVHCADAADGGTAPLLCSSTARLAPPAGPGTRTSVR